MKIDKLSCIDPRI